MPRGFVPINIRADEAYSTLPPAGAGYAARNTIP
jgi:hypothetical protein